MPARLFAIASIVLAATAPEARAQSPAPAPSASDAALPAETAEQQARRIHARGLALYDVGRFDEAIAAFKEAYALAPAAGLLFNIAQCYRAKGPEGCRDALHFYRTYLRMAPEARNRDFVLARIDDMEACERRRARARDRARAAASAPRRAAAAESAASPFPWPPVLIGAVGLSAAAVGLGLYVSSHLEYQRLESTCNGRCAPSEWKPYQTRQQVGIGLTIGGGALTAAGLVWLLVEQTGSPTTPSARATLGRF